jgi:hypothetical protein
MKLTERQLRSLVRRTLQEHNDGQPFPGSLQDLAKHHGKFWAHGEVVDPKGWDDAIDLAVRFTLGKASSPLQRKKKRMPEARRRYPR